MRIKQLVLCCDEIICAEFDDRKGEREINDEAFETNQGNE
jgi:hypothetical protein